ncbi:hypothetical protein FWJ25_09205 [Marinobacter salinexigens]|uniref:Uncharacterized protein n=1 Tax=Marinobacter salinexigens TaxID=2919747 RepID=A0A5B0VI52_9GAMM|nr:DUF6231 family protein [Marinobacter salinexigens]KAA1174400.1 hypothetical protein FWJ25_09205 [Marinobacter salinexigens]
MSQYNSALTQVFTEIVATTLPSTIVTFGNVANAAAEAASHASDATRKHIHISNEDSVPDNPEGFSTGLALLSSPIDQLPPEQSSQLIGTLRNLGTRHIAVALGQDARLCFRDLIALGFRRHAVIETDNGALTLYTYNLDTYNHKRAWNNAKHWANPEMWGKAWW